MAKPIEPTPPLDAEDSARLLRDLENVCSPEEAERRRALAKQWLADVTRPKPRRDDTRKD